MSDLLPLFPLELVLFPETPLPLHIFEPRYKEMIGECLREKSPFGIVRAKGNHLSGTGCTAEIIDVLRTHSDGRMDILTLGRQRFEVLEFNDERSFLRGSVQFFQDDTSESESKPSHELRASALELHAVLEKLTGTEPVKYDSDAECLSFHLGASLPVDLDFKQTLLQMRSEQARLTCLVDYYTRVIPKLQSMMFGKKAASGNGWIH